MDLGTDSSPYPKITVEVNDFLALAAGDTNVGSVSYTHLTLPTKA